MEKATQNEACRSDVEMALNFRSKLPEITEEIIEKLTADLLLPFMTELKSTI